MIRRYYFTTGSTLLIIYTLFSRSGYYKTTHKLTFNFTDYFVAVLLLALYSWHDMLLSISHRYKTLPIAGVYRVPYMGLMNLQYRRTADLGLPIYNLSIHFGLIRKRKCYGPTFDVGAYVQKVLTAVMHDRSRKIQMVIFKFQHIKY